MAWGFSFSYMQIVDLRQIQSRTLEPLFQEEIRRWREDLYWDYRPSIELIRKFIDSRALGGYVAMENGSPPDMGFTFSKITKASSAAYSSPRNTSRRRHAKADHRNAGRLCAPRRVCNGSKRN